MIEKLELTVEEEKQIEDILYWIDLMLERDNE
jgi:hypothetical protein